MSNLALIIIRRPPCALFGFAGAAIRRHLAVMGAPANRITQLPSAGLVRLTAAEFTINQLFRVRGILAFLRTTPKICRACRVFSNRRCPGAADSPHLPQGIW